MVFLTLLNKGDDVFCCSVLAIIAASIKYPPFGLMVTPVSYGSPGGTVTGGSTGGSVGGSTGGSVGAQHWYNKALNLVVQPKPPIA